jgi:hypothetical protein
MPDNAKHFTRMDGFAFAHLVRLLAATVHVGFTRKQRPGGSCQNEPGALVDASARVIGMVTAGVSGANSINFAIPIELAPRALPSLGTHCQCIVVYAPKKAPIFLDGNMIGQGPSCALLPDGDAHEVFAVINGKMQKAIYTGLQRRELTLR